MEPNGVASYRNRRSPSSDRFLGVFSPPSYEMISGDGDELNEDDVFWTGDFSESKRQSATINSNQTAKNRQSFRHPEKFGILAALPEDNRKPNRPVFYRNPSILSTTNTTSSSRMIPSIPRPKQEGGERKFQQSAPVNVPLFSRKVCNGELADVDVGDEEEDEEMLPPHEIVARGSSKSPKTTFSVLEGVGRTLKGRDLRLVRNAVWRKTGFLD